MEILQREDPEAERFLFRSVMNLPWSRCMKVQRGTSVNGDDECC